jgi:hypothetical protein
MSLYSLDLSLNRKLRVVSWRDEIRIDLRIWKDGKPTKIGVSLTADTWKFLSSIAEVLNLLVQNKTQFVQRLVNNYCISMDKAFGYISNRKFIQPEESPETIPTSGVAIPINDWHLIYGSLAEINKHIPNFDVLVPCEFTHDMLDEFDVCPRCGPSYKICPGFSV